jgi:hypothetical protein
MKLEFSQQIFKKISNIRSHQFRPVGSELFHADGQTDGWRKHLTKLIVAFRNFANASENQCLKAV